MRIDHEKGVGRQSRHHNFHLSMQVSITNGSLHCVADEGGLYLLTNIKCERDS